MGIEAIGVDHGGDRRAAGELARERECAGSPPEAGPERQRPAALCGLEHGIDARARERAVLVGQSVGHQLGEPAGGEDRSAREAGTQAVT